MNRRDLNRAEWCALVGHDWRRIALIQLADREPPPLQVCHGCGRVRCDPAGHPDTSVELTPAEVQAFAEIIRGAAS